MAIKKRDHFKLGITVIIMFLLMVGAALFVGGSDLLAPAMSDMVVRFAPGTTMPELTEGSLVIYFGQRVGQVTRSQFVESKTADLQLLEVYAKVQQGLNLREDCRIVATGPPLGGKGHIEILNRGTSSTPLSETDYILGSISGFQAILDNLSQELDENDPTSLLASIKLQLNPDEQSSLIARIHNAVDSIGATGAALTGELDRTRDDVVLSKLHAVLDDMDRSLKEVLAMVQESRPKVDDTLTSIRDASHKLDVDVLGVVARELQLEGDTQPGTLLTKIHDSLDCMKTAMYDFSVVSEQGKSIVVLNKDRINQLVENTTEASALLRRGVKDVSLHPWKMLFQPSDAEKRELHIFNVAREFTQAAAHLDDASSRLKSLVDSRTAYISAQDPDLVEIQSDLETTIRRVTAAEQALLRELNVE